MPDAQGMNEIKTPCKLYLQVYVSSLDLPLNLTPFHFQLAPTSSLSQFQHPSKTGRRVITFYCRTTDQTEN